MTTLILIRGPAAVGKSTLARELAYKLKSSAYICEDLFRGYMQVKRGEVNTITYKNSGILVKTTINKLLELDDYQNIIIEGLLPDEEVLSSYFEYAKEHNFKIILFQLYANKNTLLNRNKVERGHTVKESAIDDHLALLPKTTPKEAILINNEGTMEETLDKMIENINSLS